MRAKMVLETQISLRQCLHSDLRNSLCKWWLFPDQSLQWNCCAIVCLVGAAQWWEIRRDLGMLFSANRNLKVYLNKSVVWDLVGIETLPFPI